MTKFLSCILSAVALTVPVGSAFAQDASGSGEWKNVGMATFMDGWVLPMLGIDQTLEENQYEVMLQRSRENENLYRLVDPYKSGPAADFNIHSTKEGYIEFDVSDPEHVIFNMVGAGFAYNDSFDGEKKFNELYCVNFLGQKHIQFPQFTLASLIRQVQSIICFTTFDNGVVELGYKDYGEGDIAYDAHYGTDYKTSCNGFWADVDDKPLNMSARIVFPLEEMEDPEEEDPKEEDPATPDITGIMATQLDMNQGYGETTDLLAPEFYEVSASYNPDKKELTLYNFVELEPITFTVDPVTGAAVADDQVALEETSDSQTFTYFYGDIASDSAVVNAVASNYGDSRTKITVSPWGEFLKVYEFFNTAYFNTVVLLDTVIPGLEIDSEVASLDIADVDYSLVNENGYTMVFTVEVEKHALLMEDAEVNVYFIAPDSDEPQLAIPNDEDGNTYSFSFRVTNAETTQTVTIFAESWMVKSAEKTVEFVPSVSSGIGGVEEEGVSARYFNLQGMEVRNPAKGELVIRVAGDRTKLVRY